MSSEISTPPGPPHRVVSREEWLEERTALLAKEKAFTQLRDELAEQRRALPWVRVDKQYTFDGPTGKQTLGDLFQGKRQLFLKHFMLPPGQTEPCVGCSFEVDHVTGYLVHLEHHDVAYAVVARAPIEEIEVVRKRMGWNVHWVSSLHSEFNYDFNVSFTPEQLAAKRAFYNYRWQELTMADQPGESVFYRDEAGQIFHTYSLFSRGCEDFLTAYRVLDVMPRGRNEGDRGLMSWVRLHDRYDQDGAGEPNGAKRAAAGRGDAATK